jgi:mevalonate kinase
MIPDQFEALWKKGIETNAYYLKLCGSGGGGFVLGFTEDMEEAGKLLKGHNLKVIHRF